MVRIVTNAAPVEPDWIPQTPPDHFGRRLNLLRAELGLTIEEIVALCNGDDLRPFFNKATWSTWENGKKPRDMAEVVERVHKATQVNRGWLMWGANMMRKANGHLFGLPSEKDSRYGSARNTPPVLVVLPPVID